MATVADFPKARADWHPRNDRTPELVTAGTHAKAWWLCSVCGHEWFAEYCKRQGISLIVIPYWDFGRIADVLRNSSGLFEAKGHSPYADCGVR